MIDFTIPFGPLLRGFKILQAKAIPVSTEKVTERLRKAACKFQLEYINYNFTCSRLHKRFKETSNRSKKAKKEKLDEMNDFVDAGLKKIFGNLSAQLENYFKETHASSIPPRLGIHLLTEDNEIINVIQISQKDKEAGNKKIADYTSFEEVVDTGKPYLNNNIPSTVIRKTEPYKHKGLDINRIKEDYQIRTQDHKLISRWRNHIKRPKNDSKWSIVTTGSNVSMYKSHIVVPITFRRHAEKKDLNNEIINILKLQNDGRSILGFLCVDHPETYYFDDSHPHGFNNIDINTLVIFADMLSFVIVSKLMYTSGSQTVTEFDNS